MAIGDQVGKAAADEFVGALPGIQKFIDEQLDAVRDTVTTAVGDALKAVTFEREEALKAADDMVHGWLDRIGAAEIRTLDGRPLFTFYLPTRKEKTTCDTP